MANVIVAIGKDIEIAAEDVLHWAATANAIAQKATPGVLGALGVLATGIEKAAIDVAGDANNPLVGIITNPGQLADFIALWPEVKVFLASIGITKL